MRLELAAGENRLVVDAGAGGRLASFVAGGAERLLTEPDPQAPDPDLSWGAFPMAPYAGRVRDAVLAVDGGQVSLPPRYAPHGIHGLVLDQEWDVIEASQTAVHLRCPLPWELGGSVASWITLEPGRMTRRLEVHAVDRSFPGWAGWHPWFRRPASGDLQVKVDAGHTLVTDDDQIPTGERTPVTGATDLRAGEQLGDRRLDHVYPDVRWPAHVRWPDLTLLMDSTASTAVVHTPEAGVCIEPQTAWPDAAALAALGYPAGVVDVAPGRPLSLDVTWTWSGA